MLRKILALTIILLTSLTYPASATSDTEQRYLGWLWFEEKPPVVPSKDNSNNESQAVQTEISSPQAKAEIEQFAKELEELKFMMLARPTVENVKAYRDKEKLMWTQAMALHEAWDMANLLYPDQRDLINNPVNVHAVKAKRELVRSQDSEKIKKLAKEFDLVLFFDPNCTYCKLLSPVLASFGEQYGFNIEAISTSNVKHEHFKTANVQGLAESLGITAFPTVIAISHEGKDAFELIRGYVTISELEEYSLLMIKHLENRNNPQPPTTSLIQNNGAL
jgi:hypothetical protein